MTINSVLQSTSQTLLQTAPWGGTVRPPGPVFGNPVEGISQIAIFGIRMVLVVAMVMVLVYLLWGAFDWITGGGDQEKIDKARQKITNAILGIIIMVASLGLFMVVTGDVLGIIRRDSNGNWTFSIPSIQGN